jgi:RNA ligase
MKFNLDILNKYLGEKLLIKNDHPKYPISSWNYSRICQYENKWDEITIQCRGLILDNEGNVIARGFDKFFNYEEHKPEEIPNEYFDIYEKMDGSCILCFYYDDMWMCSTKGGFTNKQCEMANKLLKKYPTEKLDKNNTYVFELISPNNFIVVNYGEYEGLVLLASFNNKIKNEVKRCELEKLEGFELVTKYSNFGDGWDVIKREIPKNKEGYVVHFKNGFRMKIKSLEYIDNHKIKTEVSNLIIWEYLKENGNIDEILENVPDEFDKKIKQVVRELRYSHYQVNERVVKLFQYKMYGKYNDLDPETDRKKYAEWVMDQEKVFRHILFKMFDNKEYKNDIWDIIKPKNNIIYDTTNIGI